MILAFQPGDDLLVGNQEFDVKTAGCCLHAEDGTVFDFSGHSVSPLPRVLVGVADADMNAKFMLLVSAPRHIRITRICKEGGL